MAEDGTLQQAQRQPDQPPEASALSHAALRDMLLQMSAADRELPSERQMVDELGVPRSRLRRVLAQLREAGDLPPAQVGRKPQRRDDFRIDALVGVANPNDVIELRLIIEPQLARLAAIRASTQEITRILRSADTSGSEDAGASDRAFHREVARSSRNGLAQQMYDLLRQVGTDSRLRLAQNAPACPKRRAQRDAEHQAIGRAIADRNPERAEALMHAHLVNVRDLIERRTQGLGASSAVPQQEP